MFPEGFLWGASSSAYQIEGAHDADGKGPSVWDKFCERDGAIRHGDRGDIACDHYNRYDGDVELMSTIGIRSYRLSVSWPRVMPEGRGAVNEAGLDFYDRLIDALLAKGIQPWVTLFHWDTPYALGLKGGWLNREIADDFGEYVRNVVGRLGDRVSHWMTINEPQCFIGWGLGDASDAPNAGMTFAEKLLWNHNVLLAHGEACDAIREVSTLAPKVGWAPVAVTTIPDSDSEADVEAARRLTLGCQPNSTWNNTWYMDPVFFGRYPEEGLRAFGNDVPRFPDSDMERICKPQDFMGINIYQAERVRAGADGHEMVPPPPGAPRTNFDWPVVPEALRWGPRFISERYDVPLYMTENGLAGMDWVAEDGRVHDPQRIDFMCRYLKQLRLAIDDGVNMRGYFHWSILDNLEWAEGYGKRFGLIHVDFTTLERTLKDSAYFYRRVIKTNGEAIRDGVGAIYPDLSAMAGEPEAVAATGTSA
ncbi:MAG: GH1 family beta-glucosidase [Planctomycetota bacterium]